MRSQDSCAYADFESRKDNINNNNEDKLNLNNFLILYILKIKLTTTYHYYNKVINL